jgi:hypothetical protein
MRRLHLWLLAALLLSSACAGGSLVITEGPPPPPAPGYIYSYADGSCWADDVWYPRCPWYAGPHYGYYYSYGGSYYWHPQHRWDYRPGYPPPRVRIRVNPPPRYRVPGPVIRDHRRDHRRRR